MKIDLIFSENNQNIDMSFGEVNNISDGGFERGYEAGYESGYSEGEFNGYKRGLSERKYEVWTITLSDGTTVEKEMALI